MILSMTDLFRLPSSFDGAILGEKSNCRNRFCVRAWRPSKSESTRTYAQRSAAKSAQNLRQEHHNLSIGAFVTMTVGETA